MAEVVTEPAAAEDDLLQPYAALIEKIKTPIAPDDPCGEVVRYDDDFQELKSEIDKMGDIDYERIVELGHSILSTKSKDLTTAGFLSLGLLRTKGIEGMAEAIIIIDTLVETFWEHVHPIKPIRRRNAIQYVADQLKSWLDQRLGKQKPTEEERAPLEVAQSQLKELQGFTMKELEDKAPALSGVLKSLQETIRRLPKPVAPEPKPEAAPPQTATATASATAATATAPPATAVPTTFASASDVKQTLFKVASHLRDEDRKNPIPYRLLRVQRWGRLMKEPPNDGGKTKIPAPVAQRLAYFSGLLEKGEYEKLLEEGEDDFQGKSIYLWLGLQRLMASSAEALGVPYQGVAEAVMIETAVLLKRVPGLVGMSFNDGTPFVDPMTQEWLDTKVNALLGAGEGGGGDASAGGGGGSHVDAQYAEARKKLGTGDLAGALGVMRQDSGKDASEEDRFRRRLYVAVLCVRGNQPNMARAMLESLDEEASRFELDTWNPALTLEVWGNLYTCYSALSKKAKPSDKAAFADQASEMLDKISRLDPGYALKVLGQM